MKKNLSKLLTSLLLTVVGTATSAAPQWCTGGVSNIWINSSGTVFVLPSYRGDYTRICSVNAETDGVSETTCIAWFAMLRNAVQRKSSVIVFYADATSCNALPTYANTPIPFYVMQMD